MGRRDESERVESLVLLARIQAEHAKQMLRELDLRLAKTKDRIEQSRRRIGETDRLITELSGSIFVAPDRR